MRKIRPTMARVGKKVVEDSGLIEKKVGGKYHCMTGPAVLKGGREGWFMMDVPHRYYGPTTNWRDTGNDIVIGDGYWFLHGLKVR